MNDLGFFLFSVCLILLFFIYVHGFYRSTGHIMDMIEEQATDRFPMTENKEIVRKQFQKRVILPGIILMGLWFCIFLAK